MSKHKNKTAIAAAEDQIKQEDYIVKRYLTMLDQRAKARKPRWANPNDRLIAVNDLLTDPDLDVLKRVHLVQERIDLVDYITSRDDLTLAEAQADFHIVAGNFSERKGISYAAWRACGVPAHVLKEAGIK